MRDLELGYFLLAGISCGVWSDVRCSSVGVDMVLASFLHMQVTDTLNNLIRIDLQLCISAVLKPTARILKVLGLNRMYLHDVRETYRVDSGRTEGDQFSKLK